MISLAETIADRRDEILRRWMAEAERAASARGLSQPELRNLMPAYLTALGETPPEALGTCSGRRREVLERHLGSRLRQGFDLPEIVEELALLGRCIVAGWRDAAGDAVPAEAVGPLHEELGRASAVAADLFRAHLLEEQQAEKRYVRRLETIAQAALRPGTPPYRERLTASLAEIMEAMVAQSVALLLHDPATRALVTAASCGAGGEALERYAASLDPRSFAGRIADRDEPTQVWDAETTELVIGDQLRRSGIHSLLGIRLPARIRLVGVLYVGLAETRRFTAAELGRLETLGERLTLHLDTAKLHTDLLDRIEDLQAERALRERFVSALAHDLRGPLSIARLKAERLATRPHAGARRELGAEIVAAIDRTDRMIRDLLDATRIRAGEALPLQLAELDLARLARDVAHDLAAVHGARFVVDAPAPVRGVWSGDELARALWNLATNAVKYGEADAPIAIAVRRRGDRAELAVHNRGAPITPTERARLFEPFARSPAAPTGRVPGWGLGLTLVRGCAEAHGGSVRVDSDGAGTTFTIELPLDARPPAGVRASD